MNLLRIEDLRFAYGARTVLQVPALHLAAGEHCAVLGPSGSGKSTLMHLIAGLLRPSSGLLQVGGQSLAELSPAAADRYRGRHLGIVFQRLHLLPALSVLDNLLLAQRCARVSQDRHRAVRLLEQLGIAALCSARPSQLSQGQAQRVAIARALVHRPQLLLADEPTSSLDGDSAQQALDLLQTHAASEGASLLVVTHDLRIRGRLDRELNLGRLP